ncbi:MAG: DUF983 domain-containing protein [Alphaproteobacteria bacterium]
MEISARIDLRRAIRRGFACLCPKCGNSNLYRRYLKTETDCGSCGAPVGNIRTDDIAPYFTIMIVGHIVVPLLLGLEQVASPPGWVHWLIWPPVTIALTYWFLPRVKGSVLGWMLWLGMRGDEQH